MKIRGSVVGLSFIFPLPPEDGRKKKKRRSGIRYGGDDDGGIGTTHCCRQKQCAGDRPCGNAPTPPAVGSQNGCCRQGWLDGLICVARCWLSVVCTNSALFSIFFAPSSCFPLYFQLLFHFHLSYSSFFDFFYFTNSLASWLVLCSHGFVFGPLHGQITLLHLQCVSLSRSL